MALATGRYPAGSVDLCTSRERASKLVPKFDVPLVQLAFLVRFRYSGLSSVSPARENLIRPLGRGTVGQDLEVKIGGAVKPHQFVTRNAKFDAPALMDGRLAATHPH